MAEVQPFQPLPGRPWPANQPGEAAAVARRPRLALSTMWGIGRLSDLGDLVDEARQLGITQLELSDECRPPLVEQVIARLGDDVKLTSLHNVCPWPVDEQEEPLSLPSLAEPDPLAREVIVRWTEETIRLASYWGVPTVVLHVGEAPLGRDLEREALPALLAAGQRDTPAWRAALQRLHEHRQAVVGPYLAAALHSLEGLALLAEEAGVVLGLETRADYLDLPNFDEMGHLLAHFDPGVVGYWHDTGHAQRQATLGLQPATAWLTAYGDRLVGVHLHDCAGLRDHLTPGAGAVDFAAVLAATSATTPCVCELNPSLTVAQVAAGLAHLRALGFDGAE